MAAPAQPAKPPLQASSTTPNKSEALLAKLEKLDESPLFAGFIITLFLVPLIAEAFTITIYTSPSKELPIWLLNLIMSTPASWLAIFGGSILAIFVWWILACISRRFATVDSASKYSGLQLRSQFHDLRDEVIGLESLANPNQKSSLKKIKDSIREIECELDRTGLRWVLASGYISAWKNLHRVQEAMILVRPCREVIYGALHDEMRLLGSNIACSESELNKLRMALKQLSPSATIYLTKQPSDKVQADNSNPKGSNTATNRGIKSWFRSNVQNPSEVDSNTEMEARSAMREVRQTINEFCDDLWEGLARSRNELMATAIYTGLLNYLLLAVAIIAGVAASTITAAAGFEVVGAIAGLFGRLYQEWNRSDVAVEDYYLVLSRTIVTPFLSGLAALGGILVFRALSLSLVSMTASQVALPPIENLYQPSLENFVVAAIFGLTPNLLIGTLQRQSENLKTQIKNSSAPDQAKP